MVKKIVAVITDILGERVVVCERELDHAIADHFTSVPQDIILELLERILKDPSEIFCDDRKHGKSYNFFYKLEKGPKYLVVIIKITKDGAFFASMYPTGKRIRHKHKGLKKVKI